MNENETDDAVYCTLWDGDILLKSECSVNIKEHRIFNIKQSDVCAD